MPARSAERSAPTGRIASCLSARSDLPKDLAANGITAPGLNVAQFGAQAGLQQSISSWLADASEAAIGQSGAIMAKAGLEVTAKERANQIRT